MVETIRHHLLDGDGCLCGLPEDARGLSLRARPTFTIAITHLSAMRLLLSTRRRQSRMTDGCPAVESACEELLFNDCAVSPWSKYLLDVLQSSETDAYIRHAAVCVAAETALCCSTAVLPAQLIDGLMQLSTAQPSVTAAAAINVFTRLLNASDDEDDMDVDDGDLKRRPGTLCVGNAKRSAPVVVRDIKTQLLDQLHDRWPDIVDAVVSIDGCGKTPALAELVRLWKSVFIASTITSIDRFYSPMSNLQNLLYRTDTDSYVWLNTVRLLGAGLSRGCGPDEPASVTVSLAAQVVDGVTRRRLLYFAGKQNDGVRGSSDGNLKAVQETTLLTMRALRVHAFAADSVGAIVDAVDCLDSYVKSRCLYAPDVPFCRWLVRLMCDRDDSTVECLMCSLDVADAVPAARPKLEPLDGFVEFLACVSYEPDVLLDFLMSGDNGFLPYALRILKTACRDATLFFRCCGDRLELAIESLIKLRLKILRLHENRVFPYNVVPIARLIQRCDDLYSEFIS